MRKNGPFVEVRITEKTNWTIIGFDHQAVGG